MKIGNKDDEEEDEEDDAAWEEEDKDDGEEEKQSLKDKAKKTAKPQVPAKETAPTKTAAKGGKKK